MRHSSRSPTVNCSPRIGLDGEPDIAGIGVMIAFMLTASVTIAASLLTSFIQEDITIFWKPRFQSEASRQRWLRVLDRFTLSLSDQQLITGTAILFIGYIKLPHGISIYHFSLITNLAMFSCSAHLASVLSLRRYFQRNPQVAWLRICLMIIFALLLCTSLCVYGAYWGASDDGEGWLSLMLREPVVCGRGMSDHYSLCRFLGAILAIYIVVCYWAAFAYVYPNAEVFFTKWLLTKPLEAIKRCLSRHDVHERFMHWRPRFPALGVSHALQALWWIASLALSASLRKWGFEESQAGKVEESEHDWSVGQILSLLLLCLPVLSAVDIYFEEANENKAREAAQGVP